MWSREASVGEGIAISVEKCVAFNTQVRHHWWNRHGFLLPILTHMRIRPSGQEVAKSPLLPWGRSRNIRSDRRPLQQRFNPTHRGSTLHISFLPTLQDGQVLWEMLHYSRSVTRFIHQHTSYSLPLESSEADAQIPSGIIMWEAGSACLIT